MSEDSLESKTTIRQTKNGWGIVTGTLWAAVAFVGPQFAIIPLVPLFIGLTVSDNGMMLMIRGIVDLITLVAIFTIIRVYGLWPSSIGLGKITLQQLGLAIVAFPVYIAATTIVNFISQQVLPKEIVEQQQNIGFSNVQGIELLLVFIALVIVVPFVEEVVFRGFLLRAYRQKLGAIWGTVLVSLLFAVAHMQLNVGIDVFILSLILCYVRIKTDSLWPAVIIHALKNFLAFYLLFIMKLS